MKEIGVVGHITIKSDASAAVGIVMRRGLGRVRHIDVAELWIQEKVSTGIVSIKPLVVKTSPMHLPSTLGEESWSFIVEE